MPLDILWSALADHGSLLKGARHVLHAAAGDNAVTFLVPFAQASSSSGGHAKALSFLGLAGGSQAAAHAVDETQPADVQVMSLTFSPGYAGGHAMDGDYVPGGPTAFVEPGGASVEYRSSQFHQPTAGSAQPLGAEGAGPVEKPVEPECSPDYGQCPKGWDRVGTLCVAGGGYSGPCPTEQDLSNATPEQLEAWAQTCKYNFPCQGRAESELMRTAAL